VNSISGFERLRKKTVQRDLERRLRAVEVAGSGAIEFWIYQGDGMVRGPNGQQMTREEAESQCRAAGKFAHFCSETDMRL
jgi:hypothetical protein